MKKSVYSLFITFIGLPLLWVKCLSKFAPKTVAVYCGKILAHFIKPDYLDDILTRFLWSYSLKTKERPKFAVINTTPNFFHMRYINYFLKNKADIEKKTACLQADLDELSQAVVKRIVAVFSAAATLVVNEEYKGKGGRRLFPFLFTWDNLVCGIETIEIERHLVLFHSKMNTIFACRQLLKKQWRDKRALFNEMYSTYYGLDCFTNNPNFKNKDIIDGGGNIGGTALLLSEFNPRSIHTFEPESSTVETLRKNIKICGKEGIIKIVQKGLSSKSCELELFSRPDSNDAGASLIDRNILGEEGYKTTKISVTSIDDYVTKNILNVGMIHLDIEGAEYDAITGAVETLKSQKPVLHISLYHTPKDFFEIKPYIEDLNLGYKFFIRQLSYLQASDLVEFVLIAYVPD